jgi:thymidylate kinase
MKFTKNLSLIKVAMLEKPVGIDNVAEKKNQKNDFLNLKKCFKQKKGLDYLRIYKPTGTTICFLGPDGSGKSTIINGLLEQTLPFERNDYFHLKPIVQKGTSKNAVVTDPQGSPVYSKFISFIKLMYFFSLYNFGWIKNIIPLTMRSSLVIFDRYYDDILVDNRRFRYGGSHRLAKFIRFFILRPKLYFILTAEADIIHKRKQEVSLDELNRQLVLYRNLGDGKRYFNIDVNRPPELIVKEITNILMDNMHERY